MIRFTPRGSGTVEVTTATKKQLTPVPPSAAKEKDYRSLLRDIKSRIRAAQIRASLSVNRELIELYWDVGEMIVNRQRIEGWGKSIVDRIAADLQKDFPGIEGFSPRNIWRMRAFYVAWAGDKPQRTVAKGGQKGPARLAPREKQFLPQAVAEIPWGHNVTLVEKLKDSVQRTWYARQATVNGWSRSMLDHWIESDLYSRQGKAVTDRQIEPATPLGYVGRREIDRDSPGREFKVGIHEGRAYAIPALLNDGGRQSNNTECGQARSEAHLDLYERRVQAQLRAAGHDRDRHSLPWLEPGRTVRMTSDRLPSGATCPDRATRSDPATGSGTLAPGRTARRRAAP
jgi:predicted nuclease of restriction endonuclease-like (RecB) superfamily